MGARRRSHSLRMRADLPLTFGILADTGPGQRKALADERKAGTDFVNRLLRENKDKGFVLHFDKEVELLQDVTTSHDKLAKGIDQISAGDAPHNSGSGRKRDDAGPAAAALFFRRKYAVRRDLSFLQRSAEGRSRDARRWCCSPTEWTAIARHHCSAQSNRHSARIRLFTACTLPRARRATARGTAGAARRGGGGYPGGGGGGYPGGGGPFPGGGGPFPGGGRETRAAEHSA